MGQLIILLIVGVSYTMGFISHNHRLREKYEDLQRSYNQLYSLDNKTIRDLEDDIYFLEKKINRLAPNNE